MIKIQSFSTLPLARARKGKVYSIALSHPSNVGVHASVKCLMPTWDMVRGFKQHRISEAEYTKRYRELMIRRWPAVKQWLDSLDGNMYLCCWCTTGFCHRYLVAKLIQKFRPELEVKLS